MKILQRNSIHINGKSHDVLIVEIGNKKVKFTYNAYNAAENCQTEIFDGYKWNFIFSIMDLGVTPESSAYNIWSETKRKQRADDLFKKAQLMIEKLLTI